MKSRDQVKRELGVVAALTFALLALPDASRGQPPLYANIAGHYTGSETAMITLTGGGSTDSTTVSVSNVPVQITQVGNTYSFVITDPATHTSSGLLAEASIHMSYQH